MESMSTLLREVEPIPDPPLDKEAILDRLFDRVSDMWGINIEESDTAYILDLLGDDDNDFLGNLVWLAVVNEIDPKSFFIYLGVPIEYTVELDWQTE